MLLAISVGNTNVRFAGFVEGRLERRGFVSLGEPHAIDDSAARLGETLTEASLATASDVVLASVNGDALPAIETALEHLGLHPRVAGRDFRVPIENRYHRPEEVGIDRLLGVLAATRLFPGEGVAVVDFGTALTINVGSPGGEFVGGLIAAGAATATAALAERTSRLPAVRVQPASGFLACDTATAIRDGVFWQVVGGVERMLRGVREECGWPLHTVATGGDAAVFAPHVDGLERVESDLVLVGLRHACEGRP